MNRYILIACLLLGVSSEASVLLKGESLVIQGQSLKVEDVFSGEIPSSQETTIVKMAPGEKVTLKPHNLKAISDKWMLEWSPVDPSQQVVITRAKYDLMPEEIKSRLHQALVKHQGNATEYDLDLVGIKKSIALPVEDADSWTVEVQSYSPTTSTLHATLCYGDRQDPLSARAYPLEQVPVLVTAKLPNELITKQDVTWKKVRLAHLDARSVRTMEELVGTTARTQPVQAQVVVRRDQLMQPNLVTKGNTVTIEFASPIMYLSTKGKAMESGVKKDTIRVMNLTSKKIIEAEITGVDKVTVAADIND